MSDEAARAYIMRALTELGMDSEDAAVLSGAKHVWVDTPIGDVTALAARQFRFAAERTDANGTDILAPLSELHDLGFALQDAQMFPEMEGDGFSASLRWEANVVIAFPVTT